MKRDYKGDVAGSYGWVQTESGNLLVAVAGVMGLLEKRYNEFFARWGVSETKFNALALIYKNKDMALHELGDQMLVSRANITGLMDRLEKADLVVRKNNPHDRRSLTAQLTDKGRALVEEIMPELSKFTENAMDGLSANESKQMLKLLEKMEKGLR